MAKSTKSGSSRGSRGGSGSRTVNKSAITGRFVSDSTVTSKPRTTYRQTVKRKGC